MSSEIKKSPFHDLARAQQQSQQQSQHAAEALRIATESAQQEHQQHDLQEQEHFQHHHARGAPVGNDDTPELTEYDLKSRDSKYRRWTPKMDQYLIKLLSDVVHSFPKGAEAEMTKKAWAYVTGQLRAANPETVYSTYTKYSCQQHLINVNHHRYKIWYVLMLHQKNNPSNTGYSYRWNPDIGRYQIIENTANTLIHDERQVKSLLYSDALSLPSLGSFNKGNLIVNDFFLSDNLRYMSVYHNDVLPMLIRSDSKFSEGLGDIYREIPKFEFRESRNEYFKPLVPAKQIKLSSSLESGKAKKRSHSDAADVAISFTNGLATISNEPTDSEVTQTSPHEDDSVDPALKRSRNNLSDTTEFENALATAAIAAINSPAVTNGRDPTPFYIKDRKWFNKLISLNESGHISIPEVLTVCEGIRDGKIPLFMLNILDSAYYPSRNNQEINTEGLPDEEVVKRIREFMIPMTFNS